MPCIAVPDSVTTGAYTVSFDLGLTHDAYHLKIDAPLETESLAGDKETKHFIFIENNLIKTQTIAIDIREYKKAQDPTTISPEFSKLLLERMFPSASVTQRTIDGMSGAIAQYTSGGITIFFAIYYPDDYTCVMPMSSYPWDEGTLQLLKTIHIERNGTA